MAIDRRQILGGLAACVAAGASAKAERGSSLYVSCRADMDGQSYAAAFSIDGTEVFSTRLPARGHAAVERPGTREIVVFARRPGNWAVVFDLVAGLIRRTLIARPDRHFYGHGAFTSDGRLLLVTENNTASGDGVIGLYDATDGYRRMGEIASRGIGPHDLKLLPDGRALAVANGGLRTSPDHGREVLNRDDLRPNLAFLDVTRDETVGVVELDPHYRALSIRHLAVDAAGAVAFGCQYQGDPLDLPPLVGVVRNGKASLLEMPELELMAMRNYVGSVALDADEALLAATSPRGSSVALWDLTTGMFRRRLAMSDVCGIAPMASDGFLLTSGNAGMRRFTVEDEEPGPPVASTLRWVWDNHLGRLGPCGTGSFRRG